MFLLTFLRTIPRHLTPRASLHPRLRAPHVLASIRADDQFRARLVENVLLHVARKALHRFERRRLGARIDRSFPVTTHRHPNARVGRWRARCAIDVDDSFNVTRGTLGVFGRFWARFWVTTRHGPGIALHRSLDRTTSVRGY